MDTSRAGAWEMYDNEKTAIRKMLSLETCLFERRGTSV
jgi:hypothetical protein